MKPLEGILVLDFSQFLAGPSAALRLADLGAEVIKVERPDGGDLCRRLYISNLELDGDSTLFHSINRNKKSFSANLKDAVDRKKIETLIQKADVMIENFRPGVMEKLGLDYASVQALNPKIVYASITGYGRTGPWKDKPGQDLLAQSLSGLTWLSGNGEQGPVPMGIAIADLYTGAHCVQGILACLVRRGITGKGGRVEVSLMESILDLQFEVITTHLNDGEKEPNRSQVNNAHAYLGAPYGIYQTQDGHLALAMGDIVQLGALLGCSALNNYLDRKTWFTHRDEIKAILVKHLISGTTKEWLAILEPADIWCAEIMKWADLRKHEGFKVLDFLQEIKRSERVSLQTTRCPIRVDGQILKSEIGAPKIGQHNEEIQKQFNL